jgi:2-polyprenyl-6-methoxyphenol hydroxylase-like FAD-dependent oxidoreductase
MFLFSQESTGFSIFDAFSNNLGFPRIDSHGFGMLNIERQKFLQDLYDTLPDQTRIKTNSAVTSIKQDENGVEVTLSNGEVEKGDMVLGCDGVYSIVKSIMWDYANAAVPGTITVKEKTGMQFKLYATQP